MIKGLIFDLDGVITETAKIHYEAWKIEVLKLGIYFSETENAKLKGLSRVDTLKAILKNHNLLQKISQEKIEEHCRNKNEMYKKMLSSMLSKKNILPGISDLLKEAKKHNLKMAIASSSHNAPDILKKLEIYNLFDYIVNPNDVKKGKPSPEIFLNACKGISLKPNEVIGFEDAIAGVKGLVDAKIKTVAITHGDEADWSIANLVLKDTSELNLQNLLNLFNKN